MFASNCLFAVGTAEEFFSFYNALQQSAAFYSNAAYRHFQAQAPNEFVESSTRQAQLSSDSIATAGETHRKRGDDEVYYDSLSTYEESARKSARARKVNFAQPLGNAGEAGDYHYSYSYNTYPHYDENGEYCEEEEGNYEGDISTMAHASVSLDSDPSSHREKKKRRKKRRAQATWTQILGSGDEENTMNHLSLDDDPYAIYEVPLNEDDYEFVSEVRLCEENNLSRTHEDDNPRKTVAKEFLLFSEEAVNEMQELYGETGAQRIIKMEETVEEDFLFELKKVVN